MSKYGLVWTRFKHIRPVRYILSGPIHFELVWASLDKFELTKTGQIHFTRVEPVWTSLNKFDLDWSIFNILNRFMMINKFKLVWTRLKSFNKFNNVYWAGTSLKIVKPVWSNLNLFQPSWVSLIQFSRFELVFTILNNCVPVWKMFIQSCMFQLVWTN